ncbi:MAG TPA: GWxTD domain-containing protein [Terracidiphilus sp.]|nr:GWxTD domain-containing protein [Terracidiphilus sp.]
MNSIFSRALAGVLLVLSLSFALHVHAADRSKSLPPRYRHWLNEEVNYIIDSSERKNFLSLNTDPERDSFIEAFWKIRNPDRNAPTNSYKEEHYRRLAYANEHYGTIALGDGFRTDRGHMYIVLGAPKQIMTYPLARNVRSMEIWFYQSPSPALPPYFYLLFYQRSLGEDFTLYSPTQDGPAKLVSTLEAMNDQQRSLDTLRKSLGDEVASIAVNLVPGDRIDLKNFEPDMTSDLLISEIQGLPDNPLTQEQLNINRLQEKVTTSILTGATAPEMSYGVFRDEEGAETLSLLLKARTADPSLIGEGAGKGLIYDMELRTAVLTSDGKPVYDQVDEITGNVSETQAVIARQKKFGAETRLPLVPGKYTVVTTLTNNLNHAATRQRTSVEMPAPKSGAISISPVVAYTLPAGVPDASGMLPFSASKVRFTPRGAQTVTLRQGEKLPLVFQLWLDPETLSVHASEKIHVHYVFGAVTASHDAAVTESEEVDPANHDAAGNLLTGHTVNTADLLPGTYRLVVGANWDGAQQTAYETMTVHVVPSSEQIDAWTGYGGAAPDVKAVDDLKRGLSAEASGVDVEAERFYAKALSEGAGEVKPLEKLAALLARKNEVDKLAALSQKPVLAETAVAPGTLLLIADALKKNGNPKGEVRMLDEQIKLQPPSAELYRAMADACEATGDHGRAHDFRALAEKAHQGAESQN